MLQLTTSFEFELKRYYATRTIDPSSDKNHQGREKIGRYRLPAAKRIKEGTLHPGLLSSSIVQHERIVLDTAVPESLFRRGRTRSLSLTGLNKK